MWIVGLYLVLRWHQLPTVLSYAAPQECLLQLRLLYKLPSLCHAQIFITCLGAAGQSILAFYSARKLAENKYLGLLRQLKNTAVDKYLVLVNV